MSEPASILLAHRYFWPDTAPYGLLLRRIAATLSGAEYYRVSVFTGQPAYSSDVVAEGKRKRFEFVDENTQVIRARLFPEKRFRSIFQRLNAVLYSLQLVLRILVKRPDAVMCSTQPPIVAAAMAQQAASLVGAQFIYHLQDIHPEVAWTSGLLRPSWASRLLLRIDARTCRKADKVVVLSDDMADSIEQRSGSMQKRPSVIQNFNLPNYSKANEVPPGLRKSPHVFRLLFAGNVGHFQNLECLVSAVSHVHASQPFELVIMGEGKAKAKLQQLALRTPDSPIRFFPYQSLSTAETLMAEAEICVVSLLPEVYRFAFPSKVVSYLSLGCPLLVIAEKDSQLGRLPSELGVGYSCDSSSILEIAKTIERIINSADAVPALRKSARMAWEKHFSQSSIEKAWLRLFHSCLIEAT